MTVRAAARRRGKRGAILIEDTSGMQMRRAAGQDAVIDRGGPMSPRKAADGDAATATARKTMASKGELGG